jgi:hypothetical protein
LISIKRTAGVIYGGWSSHWIGGLWALFQKKNEVIDPILAVLALKRSNATAQKTERVIRIVQISSK